MKQILRSSLLSVFVSACVISAQAQESLYKRLGGYDAIAAVTDDFIVRMATNKDLQRFFVGLSDDSKGKVRGHIIDLVCLKTGGPCTYTGRDMKTSHKGLAITENDWNIMAKLFVETLNKFKVAQKEQDELLAIVATTKKDIVEKM
jgi:hemoglobin